MERDIIWFGRAELLQVGYELSKSQRGKYKKDEEQANIYKMTGMLLKLLTEKQGNSYGTVDNPNIASIKKEVDKLAETHNLSVDGLSKSSFYEKALNKGAFLEYRYTSEANKNLFTITLTSNDCFKMKLEENSKNIP